jgi:hypothetical protein
MNRDYAQEVISTKPVHSPRLCPWTAAIPSAETMRMTGRHHSRIVSALGMDGYGMPFVVQKRVVKPHVAVIASAV